MADINKIGLLLLNSNKDKFLVCEKYKGDVTSDFIIPGGQVEEDETDLQCLVREIKEELNVDLDATSLEYVGKYIDVAAGMPGKYVSIKLYTGAITREPKPSQEIKEFHWISEKGSSRLSAIIKNKILPDIIARGLLTK